MSIVVSIPLPVDQAGNPLPGALGRVEHDAARVVFTRDGEPVAAVVSIADLRTLEGLDEAEDAHWSRVADEADAKWEAEGRPAGVPMEDIARELGVDLTPDP